MRQILIAVLIAAVPATTLVAQRPAGRDINTAHSARAESRLRADPSATVITRIEGNAVDSAQRALPKSLVRLRDARSGRIIDFQVTDKTGEFAFRGMDPGIYIVELVADDHRVLAASQILNVNYGDTVSTMVKLPIRTGLGAGLLSNATTAAALAASAAASGILTTQSTADVTPETPRVP